MIDVIERDVQNETNQEVQAVTRQEVTLDTQQDVQEKEQLELRQEAERFFKNLHERFAGMICGLQKAADVFSPNERLGDIYKVRITRLHEDILEIMNLINKAVDEKDAEELRIIRNEVFLRETLLGMWDSDIADYFKLLIEATME